MSDQNLLEQINKRMDMVTFVEQSADEFRLVGDVTPWLLAFCPDISSGGIVRIKDVFLFLADFIAEARDQLAKSGTDPQLADPVSSGPWSERDTHDHEQSLSAFALLLDGSLVIQIRAIHSDQRYHEAIFQKAREYSLSYEQLQKDQDKKQVLLHTIVHDIASPMMVIEGSLGLLQRSKLKEMQEEHLTIARDQAELVNQMVKNVLDVFAMDVQPFDPTTITSQTAPHILQVLNSVVRNYSGVFSDQDVNLTLQNKLQADMPVIADQWGLTRVFVNLLENAIRYSPVGAEVTITAQSDDQFVKVTVEDQGPGVSSEFLPRLFERFTGGRSEGGKAGLGLYFCKTSLKQWSGDITYEPAALQNNAQQGSCFVVHLRRTQDS